MSVLPTANIITAEVIMRDLITLQTLPLWQMSLYKQTYCQLKYAFGNSAALPNINAPLILMLCMANSAALVQVQNNELPVSQQGPTVDGRDQPPRRVYNK